MVSAPRGRLRLLGGRDGTPVGTAPNQEFLGQFADRFPEGPKFTFGEWFVCFAPLPLLFVPLAGCC